MKISYCEVIRNLSKLKRGEKIEHRNVYYYEGKSLKVELIKGGLFAETDGELIPAEDCTVSIVENAVQLINPLR